MRPPFPPREGGAADEAGEGGAEGFVAVCVGAIAAGFGDEATVGFALTAARFKDTACTGSAAGTLGTVAAVTGGVARFREAEPAFATVPADGLRGGVDLAISVPHWSSDAHQTNHRTD